MEKIKEAMTRTLESYEGTFKKWLECYNKSIQIGGSLTLKKLRVLHCFEINTCLSKKLLKTTGVYFVHRFCHRPFVFLYAPLYFLLLIVYSNKIMQPHPHHWWVTQNWFWKHLADFHWPLHSPDLNPFSKYRACCSSH